MPEANPSPDDLAPSATRERGLLGGRLRLVEACRGYHASLDAGLLAAAIGAREGERVLEAGCGVGGALLQAAARSSGARFTGVERDVHALELACRNVALNGMADRIDLQQGDVADGPRALSLTGFDAAFANPPFFDDPGALRAPSPERRGAWLADAGLAAWVDFLVLAVREGGRATLIHRADRLDDLLAALRPRAGSIRIRPVHAFRDRAAKRVIVRAVRGGRAPLVLLPAFVVNATPGDGPAHATRRAEAVLRGEAELDWREGQSA